MKISPYFTKAIICFAFSLSYSFAFAQSSNWTQKKTAWITSDSLIKSYISLMELKNLGSLDENDKSIKDFTNLFSPNAKVYDEIILSVFEGDMESPYSSRFRELPDYMKQMKQYYPSGITAQVINVSYDFSQLSKNKVMVLMQKSLSGVANTQYQYVVQVKDTIQIEIQLNENSSASINRITKIGSNAKIINDLDGDFVVDSIDKCPKEAGTMEFKGCLPPVSQSYFTLIVSKDISADTKLDHAGLSSMNYESMLANSSTMSDVSVEENATQYFGISLEYSKFTGRSKTFGYGIGLSYAHYDSEVSIDRFNVRYRSVDAYGTSYKRIISIDSKYVETIKTDYLRIPLFLHVKTKFSEKMGVFASAGIGINFAISNRSSTDNTFNYEALYSFINNSLGFSVAENLSDFIITANQAQSLNGSNEIATNSYFNEHSSAGYDVAINRSIDNIEKYKFKPGMVFEIRGGLSYDISSTTALQLGAGYISFSNQVNSPDLYMLTDRTGEATSLVSGSKYLKWNAVSINIGLTHKLQ